MSGPRWSYEWARAEARERNDRHLLLSKLSHSKPRTPEAPAWFAWAIGDGRWCAGTDAEHARTRAARIGASEPRESEAGS